MKKIVSLFLTVFLMTTLAVPEMAMAYTAGDIAVLYTNDVHCAVSANIGYAGLAAYKKDMLQTYGDGYVTLVDAGDAIQGAPIGTLSKGDYIIDIMNAVGYDIATYGNHEFDYGMSRLKELVTKSKATYVSANFTDLISGKTVSDAYKIVTYGSVKVAYVGISNPGTFTSSTPSFFQNEQGDYIYGFCEDMTGEKLYAVVQTAVDSALNEGADYVVAVSHLGIGEDCTPWRSTDVIANTTGIDAVIDGHSHSTIANRKITNKSGEDVILTSTGTQLKAIGKLIISTTGITTELVTDYTQKDTVVGAFVTNFENKFAELLNTVVAKTDVELTTVDPSTGKRIIRNSETNLGDLCADAYRDVLGADIGIVNGGGVRATIAAGDITYNDIISVHPFGNMACMVEATGQEILDALEMASRTMPEECGGFLQVSGLTYEIHTYIPSSVVVDDKSMFVKTSGEYRVKNVKVINAETGSYDPIDLDKTYTVASHNYMLKNGGDGINMFLDNTILQDEVLIDNQVLINYIVDSLGGIVGEAYSQPYGAGRIHILTQAPIQSTTSVTTTATASNPAPTIPETGESAPVAAMFLLTICAGAVLICARKKRD